MDEVLCTYAKSNRMEDVLCSLYFIRLRFEYLCYMTHVFMIIRTPEMHMAHSHSTWLGMLMI
jgi:hypothetical protein